jgi:hypothetical protein
MARAKRDATSADLDALGANLDIGEDDLSGDPIEQPRVRIILEENENIPPTGQFFGANGRGYILRPGEAADVPQSILNILDTAVMATPIVDGGNTVIGYRDKLRFPYRIVRGADSRV